ncbi:ISL3 family transposase [Neopusillimonas maritima]|uniref:ISL3 family transposase n=1 Tax=Neopusillimonas maritima TaxID=2026239 RepID=UPI001C558D4D|nr:ISL3 family transposase [Neopusillimonas maritima]
MASTECCAPSRSLIDRLPRFPYLLKGIVFGNDGRALSPWHTTKKNGRRYRYYVPQRDAKEHAGASGLPRLPAAELESAVLDQLRAILRAPNLLGEMLPQAIKLDPTLDEAKITVAMTRLDAIWDQLFPAEQTRIVMLLVEKVIVSPNDLEVRLRANGIERLVLELRPEPVEQHFFTRKKGYATTLVDLKNHKVFDVVLGRSEASLRSYLRRLPGKENVRVIVMDLSETYRRIAQQYFPNAMIVADRFHVIRLVNQHFLKLWQQYDPEGRKNRGLLSLMRRHHWRLSAVQKERLHQYLAQSPVLKALYFAKQQLNGFLTLRMTHRERASKMLPKFLALIRQFEQSPAKALANTLISWLEPIVRMWRFSKSNGITEGFHTKMEMLSRRAYGFRNFENYRLRVLAQCGWNGVINRV